MVRLPFTFPRTEYTLLTLGVENRTLRKKKKPLEVKKWG